MATANLNRFAPNCNIILLLVLGTRSRDSHADAMGRAGGDESDETHLAQIQVLHLECGPVGSSLDLVEFELSSQMGLESLTEQGIPDQLCKSVSG